MHKPDEIGSKLTGVPRGAPRERAGQVARHLAGHGCEVSLMSEWRDLPEGQPHRLGASLRGRPPAP